MALLFSGPCSIRSLLLENKPMIWIGKISYSLYLVHWPLIVFYSYNSAEKSSYTSAAILLSASVALGAALHYLVEKPLRHGNTPSLKHPEHNRFIIGYLSLALATVLISSVFWARGSLQWRSSANYLSRAEISGFNEALLRTDKEAAFRERGFSDSDSPKLLFIGDSHAEDTAFSLFTAASEQNYEFELLRFDSFCQPDQDYRHFLGRKLSGVLGRKTRCDYQLQSLVDSPAVSAATHIFFHNLSILKTAEYFPAHISEMQQRTNAKLILIGQNANFPEVDNFAAVKQSSADLGSHLYSIQSREDSEIRTQFEQLADELNIYFLDRAALVCNQRLEHCVVEQNDIILYRDSTHWNHYGREHYGQLFLNQLQKDGIL